MKNRRIAVVAIQLGLVFASNYIAFWLRFEGSIPQVEMERFLGTILILIGIRAAVFVPFRLYAGLWKYTGVSDLRNLVLAVVASSSVFAVVIRWGLAMPGYSRSVFFIDSIVLIILLSAIRLSKRVVQGLGRPKGAKRVLIFGAGDAGEMIVRDMQNRPCGYEPRGFIDDNPAKIGQRIHGVRVLGNRRDLARVIAAEQPHEILVAMPGADLSAVRGVVKMLRPFKIPITTLPGTRDILDGRVAVNQIRNLTIEDLLPRAPIDLSIEPVRALIRGRRVLITGAGGSIGSELSIQIAALGPASLVLLERYENSLYQLVNELEDRFDSTTIRPVIGDVTDVKRVEQVFAEYLPQLVFHAAAHKHVPMMEYNPCEAVKNNVAGTANVAQAAERWGVERFILISTDKAVNPSSVMGATKRIGELILQVRGGRSATRFAAVRFGNVLGSNGSVLPRFLEQIRAGGPVTVTHPEIRRFFMLIPEAVQLVLHAAALGEPEMVYVLEMGEQIKLVEMARNIIRCAGFVPDEEIQIAFVGLRPGEKLFEELIGAAETAEPSSVPKILRVRGASDYDVATLESEIERLILLAECGDSSSVVQQLRRLVPTFNPLPESAVAATVRHAAALAAASQA
ncbi:MAG TPA: nucleoside-diphosphate sugar epimerase/dehydratase [Vicinamibacterales bacterium]|nr:nucleoside-diphosphate sugar epimerase/dehydratase [Vicinamibacterales bacterium]